MWIDFKLYFYVRTHKFSSSIPFLKVVVNWFQIVFLREDSQEAIQSSEGGLRCELISNCIFTWGLTSLSASYVFNCPLWIDFKLYFYVRTHKWIITRRYTTVVVNWFQIVFLREDSQAPWGIAADKWRCELISNCIFTWGLTRNQSFNIGISLLWIDFKLYFYVRTHKIYEKLLPYCYVVNWFQIVFLREDSQGRGCSNCEEWGCELISNCIFTWGLTRNTALTTDQNQLWIDFKLYFYVRTHKNYTKKYHNRYVVNWFQIVFLREDSQDLMWYSLACFSCELISNCIFTWGLTRNEIFGI